MNPAPGLTRREWAARLVGFGMLATGAYFLRRIFFPQRLEGESLRTFEAYLDTLLPGTDPSWRATGVMPRLLDELSEERKTRRALAEGVEWLDAEARPWLGRLGRSGGVASRWPTRRRA